MPKKKVIKNKKPLSFRKKTSRAIKGFYDTRTWTKIFLTLLALWGLVWCGQVAVERYRFYDAEKKLDKLASELQKELGDEYKLKKKQYCYYRSAKFSKGDRSCRIDFVLGQKIMSLDKANEIAKAYKDFIDSENNFEDKITGADLPFEAKDASRGEVVQGVGSSLTRENSSPGCGGGLSYHILPESIKDKDPTRGDYLTIDFYCLNRAKLEYFPVD